MIIFARNAEACLKLSNKKRVLVIPVRNAKAGSKAI